MFLFLVAFSVNAEYYPVGQECAFDVDSFYIGQQLRGELGSLEHATWMRPTMAHSSRSARRRRSREVIVTVENVRHELFYRHLHSYSDAEAPIIHIHIQIFGISWQWILDLFLSCMRMQFMRREQYCYGISLSLRLSVRLSVCLFNTGTVSKRVDITCGVGACFRGTAAPPSQGSRAQHL